MRYVANERERETINYSTMTLVRSTSGQIDWTGKDDHLHLRVHVTYLRVQQILDLTLSAAAAATDWISLANGRWPLSSRSCAEKSYY